jgi:rhamnulokinase
MLTAIDMFCAETQQAAPTTPGAYVRTVLESLALKYRRVILEIEKLTGLEIKQIRVIGGGARNELLNQMTADATGRRVLAGPVEATALGNIGMQMLATGATSSLKESRRVIDGSYQTDVFEPYDTHKWEEQANVFEQYCEVRCA